jgi:ubiquinone/menaquinone biosynthesis C-methylase UbiE
MSATSADTSLLSRESHFHDAWAESESPEAILVRESFEADTAPENQYILKWLGDVSGQSVLDTGCGCGEASVYFALKGAVVTATDISPQMLALASRVATHHGVSIATALASSEELPFADESFDIVYGANVLHHSDMPRALAEVVRVLKPGGKACFWDPLAANPIINIYRRMAHKVRTPDEHPLTSSDVVKVRSYFAHSVAQYFWLTSLLVFVKFFLIDRVHPNQERYWKKVIRESRSLRWLYRPLRAIDSVILRLLPWLRVYCWNVVICGVK